MIWFDSIILKKVKKEEPSDLQYVEISRQSLITIDQKKGRKNNQVK